MKLLLATVMALVACAVFAAEKTLPGLRVVAPLALSKRVIAPPKGDLPGQSFILSDSSSNKFTLFVPNGWQAPSNGIVSLTVHFHSAPWFAIEEHLRHGLKTPLIAAQLGGGSSVYRRPFENPKRFAEWIEMAAETLKAHGASADMRIESVDISSFSAGYGAVRELLKSPDYFKIIRRIVLCDSLYGGLEPATDRAIRIPAREQVDAWAPFAKAAAQGKKTFILTHSQVPTPAYASSGEMAAALIRAVGAPTERISPAPAPDDPECRLQYRSDLGNFHIWGYTGCDGEAHMTHLRHLADVWEALGDEPVHPLPAAPEKESVFEGKYFSGSGDTEYIRLLDIARRMFAPDPQYQNMAMLYITNWNGLVEGPTWDAWWIQNSYGTTYGALPFLQEPFVTFLQNSQDLWFDQMGDGKRAGTTTPPFNWVAPDGCLCDAARPGWIVYKQGDCRTDLHDWAVEFTAAGILLQSELLLIQHDHEAAEKYLSKLERSANFIEKRRDTNDLFLAGPAANLLAPSYAGWRKPDGTYGMAYLTGLSITYIAALDRLVELEKFAAHSDKARLYAERRESARKALPKLTTEEGYFMRSLDPDGTRHGVFGAAQHGYLETSPNHDAIAFRVADDVQSERIFHKIESIPQLRPYDFILPNYPSYDDIYDKPEGLWAFGTWVNGGHWSTCEARMILAYYRLGKYGDAARSMRRLLQFADNFRMDNPLTKFGSDVYQPNQPVNLCYDSFGPPAALVRGLFEYLYHSDDVTLIPHIPPAIDEVKQRFPIRFGKKEIYLSASGAGPVTSVRVNGRRWKFFDQKSVRLPYDKLSGQNRVEITLGKGKPTPLQSAKETARPPAAEIPSVLQPQAEKLRAFQNRLTKAGLENTVEAAHVQLVLDAIASAAERQRLKKEEKLKLLPEVSQRAADQSYFDCATRLFDGLCLVIQSCERSDRPEKKKIAHLWEMNGNDRAQPKNSK